MSDALRNLPSDFLFRLVPPLVVDLDTRGLLEAVIGGFQDRISDLRSAAARFPDLVDPDPPPYRTVLVEYRADAGGIVTATLDVNSSTPAAEEELTAWAAAQLEVDESLIVSAIVGTDALREVGVGAQLLAQSLGAVLYPGLPGEDEAVVAARQRRALATYFPRLRMKGTARSFSAYARLAGFDEGTMLPLWTRLSARAPGALGSLVNDPDYRARPDFLPTSQMPDPEGVYDPLAFTDGPFYRWRSGTLSVDPLSPDFYLTAVNQRNPFIRLVTDGLTVAHPPVGSYWLDGGAFGRAAWVTLSRGTEVSHLEARALTEGEAFNGLRLEVFDAGGERALEIEAQLSTLKYRSSSFDLALFKEEAGTRAITVNPDLAENPKLTEDGTATAPFRPWAGTMPRSQAAGTATEVDEDALVGAAQRVYDLSSEVRAATRMPRRTGVGLMSRDRLQFSAYPCVAPLAVMVSAGSYGGTVGETGRPSGDYGASFAMLAPPALPKALTTQEVSAGTFQFDGTGISGSYHGDTGFWAAEAVLGFSAGTLTGFWDSPSSESLRSEPRDVDKASGAVCYTHLPEGTFHGDENWDTKTWDDVPWLRPLLAGGEEINADTFLVTGGDPRPVMRSDLDARVRDTSGVWNRALVYDLPEVLEPPFVHLRAEKLGPPVTPMMAGSGSGTSLYPVVAISPTAIVAEATWNRGRYDGAILWWPLSEHPFQPLKPTAALGPAPQTAQIKPEDRAWDIERGWALRVSQGGTVALPLLGLPDQYSFAFTAKVSGTVIPPAPAVEVGAATVSFTASSAELSVQGGGTLSVPMVPDVNTFVYVGVGTGTAVIEVGDSAGWIGRATMPAYPERGWSGAQISAGGVSAQLHDFMVWDGFKTEAELDALRAPRLVPSTVPLMRPYVPGVSGDRWAMRVLPGGFVVPDRADAAPDEYPAGEIRRYAGTGRFDGDMARKQVGLGGAQTIPDQWRLGTTGPAVPATGQTVVAGSGFAGVYDRIFLRGASGYAYDVKLDDIGHGPVLVASVPADLTFGDGVTEDGFFLLPEAEAQTMLPQPLYLYLNSRVKSWVMDARTRWVNPNPFGVAQGAAALDSAGQLLFENPDPLPAGNYRLSIDAGNIGTVDSQFAGFNIEVTVETGVGEPLAFPVVVLPEGRGTGPRGWTEVEFALLHAVTGAWRLGLRWTNDRDVPSRGEFRRLAVYAYTLRRIATELHRVIASPLTIEPVAVAAPPLVPGAYVASYNSWGTIVGYEHEQTIYPITQGVDIFNNPHSPLADTLTGSTLERRDWLDVGTSYTPPDPLVAGEPVAGTLSVLPEPVLGWYNVGEVVTLSNTGSSGSGSLRRTWQMWDSGTRSTWDSVLPGVQIDRGGTLSLSVDVVDDLGRSDRATARIRANWPPDIQLATASVPYSPVPYRTKLSAVVSDREGDNVSVSWWRRGAIEKWIGNGIMVDDYLVTDSQQIRVYAVDSRSGTSFADVSLIAGPNAEPTVSIIAIAPKKLKAFSDNSDSIQPGEAGYIEPGQLGYPARRHQLLQIAAVAADPENRGVTTLWEFWDGTTTAGRLEPMESFGGGTLCTVKLDIPNAPYTIVGDPSTVLHKNLKGFRPFSLTVTDGDNLSSTVDGEVEFIDNQVPIIVRVAVSEFAVVAGQTLYYAAAAFDPDGDEVFFEWEFPALNLILYGPNASLDTTDLAGKAVGGTLKVRDGYIDLIGEKHYYGEPTSAPIPVVAVYAASLAPLSFSPAGGLTSQGVVLEIMSPDLPNTEIKVRYTLDGSDPASIQEGIEYKGPVMIPYDSGKQVPVNARAFKTGLAPSPLASATFVFSAY